MQPLPSLMFVLLGVAAAPGFSPSQQDGGEDQEHKVLSNSSITADRVAIAYDCPRWTHETVPMSYVNECSARKLRLGCRAGIMAQQSERPDEREERAPRVLLSGVVLGQPMGGVRRHAMELLPRAGRLLAQQGGSLTVLEGTEPLAFDLPVEVTVVRCDVPSRPPLVRAVSEGSAWAAEAARARYDLVHTAHLPVPPKTPLPYALLLHDLRALSGEMAPFARRLVARAVIGRAVRGAALVLTVSETVRAELIARFHLDPEGVVVVPNAADHFAPIARRVEPDAPLVCLGHLEPRKNLELVLRALAHDPTLPRLELHGAAKHGEGERLAALARELGVENRVTFAGPFDETRLPELLARAACVVVPSLIEGFGIVALEAQLASAPLAVADAGALRETAGHETPFFAPDDPSACAASIRAALNAAPTALEAARARAAGFTWDRSAQRLVAAWRLAAARALAPPRQPRARPGPRRSR